MSDVASTVIKCSDCSKTTTVSFKPKPDRPVYCRECLAKHRTSRREPSRNQAETKQPSLDADKRAWSRRRENWK
jgi:CxxC-x17-CxxC domain-containing protein